MPMSIVGGGRGSYRRVNPQLAQCVESVCLVYEGLNKSPDEWWKKNNLSIAEKPALAHAEDNRLGCTDDGLDDDTDSDTENLMDLQKTRTGKSSSDGYRWFDQ